MFMSAYHIGAIHVVSCNDMKTLGKRQKKSTSLVKILQARGHRQLLAAGKSGSVVVL